MDESYIICNNNSLTTLPQSSKNWRAQCESEEWFSHSSLPCHCRRFKDFYNLLFTLVTQFQWQSYERIWYVSAVLPGLNSATVGNGMHWDWDTLPGHSVCGKGKSWFLAHLCVTMPTSSQFRLPPYLLSQIIFIIKKYDFFLYRCIYKQHTSVYTWEDTHFPISIFIPFCALRFSLIIPPRYTWKLSNSN